MQVYKYLFIVVFFAFALTPQSTSAQAPPGYLGKRLVVEFGANVQPYKFIRIDKAMLKYGIKTQYVLGRHFSIAAEYDFMPSKKLNIYDVYYEYQNQIYLDYNPIYHINFHELAFGVIFRGNKKHFNLHPLGNYRSFMFRYWLIGNKISSALTNIPVEAVLLDYPKTFNCIGASYGFGKRAMIANNLSIDYGAELGLSLTLSRTTTEISNYGIYETVAPNMLSYGALNLYMRFGLVL